MLDNGDPWLTFSQGFVFTRHVGKVWPKQFIFCLSDILAK